MRTITLEFKRTQDRQVVTLSSCLEEEWRRVRKQTLPLSYAGIEDSHLGAGSHIGRRGLWRKCKNVPERAYLVSTSNA